MAKNNDPNRNDDSGVGAEEAVGSVGGGAMGAVVGSALGPVETVIGGIVGA